MGTNELRKRDNWQGQSGTYAEEAEKNFFGVFNNAFEDTNFEIIAKPTDLKNIYAHVQLDEHTISRTYNPLIDLNRTKWGILPDYAIRHKITGKTLYVAVKRQDGWGEGTDPSAGRGNAHERSCKLFTPGLLNELRQKGKIDTDSLPFWVVFQGDITRDPKRVREIHFWFGENKDHFFLWRDTKDDLEIINHFDQKLKKLLL